MLHVFEVAIDQTATQRAAAGMQTIDDLSDKLQEQAMTAQELHRGRLIDHIQLVVGDIPASQRFYTAVMNALEIPMGGTGAGYFWVDELFVSTADSEAAQGNLTGRHHLAFQAGSRAMVEAFHRAALTAGALDTDPGMRPQANIFVASKAPWFDITDALPQFAEMPPS